jgi:tetratricopeptide (TPR) repeat protein
MREDTYTQDNSFICGDAMKCLSQFAGRSCNRLTCWLQAVAILCSVLVANPSAVAGYNQPSDMQSAADQLTKAHAAFNERDLPQAEKLTRQLLSRDNRSSEAHTLLAHILFAENKPGASLQEFTRAAHLAHPSADDLRIVSLDYVLLNDYPDADKWISRSLMMNPRSAEGIYVLGRIRYTENRFADALQCFDKALLLEPKLAKAENNRGLTLEALNRDDEAVQSYRRAIATEADKEHPSEQPYLNLGTLLLNKGDLAEAQKMLERAFSLAPQDPKIAVATGRLYERQGKLNEARHRLETATRALPDDAAVHFQLGRVYKKLQLPDLAAAEFARSQALAATHSSAP